MPKRRTRSFSVAQTPSTEWAALSDFFQNRRRRHAVHQIVHGRVQESSAIDGDDARRRDGRPAVGRGPGRAAPDGQRNADERGGRGNRIAAMMPGVGDDHVAVRLVADFEHLAKQHFLDHDDAGQHEQRERGRHLMRHHDFANRGDRNADGRSQQHQRHGGRGQRLGFAVAIRMRSSAGWAETCSPPHTISEAKISVDDSTASATRAYECPAMPAASLATTSAALTNSPACAARMPEVSRFTAVI